MQKAMVLTIGTEITSGEVLNANAAWVSLRLEEQGVRVLSHLSVRDQREEILKALEQTASYDWVIVTGGLGPTSDDLTRACVAEHLGAELEFDDSVWRDLEAVYRQRGLPLREAHRHQCFFPRGSRRLSNPVGTALGFSCLARDGRRLFVLPGPPRELEAMWNAHVAMELKREAASGSGSGSMRTWLRWTCLGAPESEVAELVEAVIASRGDVEVGYRAHVPYVKVKVYVDPSSDRDLIARLEEALREYVVARGAEDLADLVLARWPSARLALVDPVTGLRLAHRLFVAREERLRLKQSVPEILFSSEAPPDGIEREGLFVSAHSEAAANILIRTARGERQEVVSLPFRISLNSERGRRSIAEWALWHALKALSNWSR